MSNLTTKKRAERLRTLAGYLDQRGNKPWLGEAALELCAYADLIEAQASQEAREPFSERLKRNGAVQHTSHEPNGSEK